MPRRAGAVGAGRGRRGAPGRGADAGVQGRRSARGARRRLVGASLRRDRLGRRADRGGAGRAGGGGGAHPAGLEAGTSAPLRGTAGRLADGLALPEAARCVFLGRGRPAPGPRRAPGAPRAPGPSGGGLRLVPPPPTHAPPVDPVQPTSFVGRERELAEVARLLGGEPHPEGSRPRSPTLTGPRAWARPAWPCRRGRPVGTAGRGPGGQRAFPDGVWFVPLAPLTDPGLVLPTVAAALAAPRPATASPARRRSRRTWRGERVLLVLDNFEHLLPGAPGSPTCWPPARPAALRGHQPDGARAWPGRASPVPPLALPDPRRPPAPDRAPAARRRRLFVARAAAAQARLRGDRRERPRRGRGLRAPGRAAPGARAGARPGARCSPPSAAGPAGRAALPLLTGGPRRRPGPPADAARDARLEPRRCRRRRGSCSAACRLRRGLHARGGRGRVRSSPGTATICSTFRFS